MFSLASEFFSMAQRCYNAVHSVLQGDTIIFPHSRQKVPPAPQTRCSYLYATKNLVPKCQEKKFQRELKKKKTVSLKTSKTACDERKPCLE